MSDTTIITETTETADQPIVATPTDALRAAIAGQIAWHMRHPRRHTSLAASCRLTPTRKHGRG